MVPEIWCTTSGKKVTENQTEQQTEKVIYTDIIKMLLLCYQKQNTLKHKIYEQQHEHEKLDEFFGVVEGKRKKLLVKR